MSTDTLLVGFVEPAGHLFAFQFPDTVLNLFEAGVGLQDAAHLRAPVNPIALGELHPGVVLHGVIQGRQGSGFAIHLTKASQDQSGPGRFIECAQVELERYRFRAGKGQWIA